MELAVEHVEFCGERAVRACTDELEMILVPAWGSNVVSLKSRKKNVELLRAPESAEQFWEMPILYGIPVLFPPNRIEDGEYTYNGTTYRLILNEPETHNHSHGLLFDRPWKLLEAKRTGDAVEIVTEFDAADFPEVLEQFRHHVIVRLTFRLEGATLHKTATVINKSGADMPWGLGYHTTFNFPFRPGDPMEDCTFALTADRRWLLNERFLPTGELEDFAYREEMNEGMSLIGYSLDDVFMSSAARGGSRNEAVLHDAKSGITVVYKCDERFKHWVIYNDDGKQGYICPEPYTWVTNAPNLPLERDLTGVQVLAPGQEAHVYSAISVRLEG